MGFTKLPRSFGTDEAGTRPPGEALLFVGVAGFNSRHQL